MLPPPDRREPYWVGAVLVLLGAVAWQGYQNEQLRARPAEERTVAVQQARDVLRGPIKRTTVKTVAPDGTRTTQTVTEVASEEIRSTTARQEHLVVTPAAPRRGSRYLGLALDPVDRLMPKRVRAGLTLWDRLDAGVAWEPRRALPDGALLLELGLRF